MLFPGLGHLHKEGNGYSWAPVGGSAKGNFNEFRVVRDPTQAPATT
jgi:hypothetical protein